MQPSFFHEPENPRDEEWAARVVQATRSVSTVLDRFAQQLRGFMLMGWPDDPTMTFKGSPPKLRNPDEWRKPSVPVKRSGRKHR